jgi:hypothetical protein
MEDLAETRGEIALLLETLGQRDDVGQRTPEEGLVVEHAGRFRQQPRQDRRPGWIAHRVLHVRTVEHHTAPGESIEIR